MSLTLPLVTASLPLSDRTSLHWVPAADLCPLLQPPVPRLSFQSPLTNRWGPSSPVRGPYLAGPGRGPIHPRVHPWKRAKIDICGLEALECTTIGGSLKQIDASVGQVVGVSSTDAVFVRYGNNWVQLPEALKHVSVGLSGVWGINKDNYIYKMIDTGGDEFVAGVNLNDNICLNRDPTMTVHSTDPIPWNLLPGALKYYSCGPYSCWGVNSGDQIYVMKGVTPSSCMGSNTWQNIPGALSMIEVSTDSSLLKQIDAGGDEFVAGVNMNGNTYCLNRDPTMTVHSTDPIPWNLLPGALKYYSCGPYSCWGVNSGDQIYVMKGVTPSSCMGSNTWQNIPGALSMIEVSTDSSVYGVNSGGDIFCR
ncbi:UNVERIFIED_CONTAM: hypothetical protein FKN15_021820 [Acipenser sinensis]